MALEADHIRFALDVKHKYEIKNLGEYLSGTIYPDSRYKTGIKRNLTHDDGFLKKEFAFDDFKKGWQAHLAYDNIQEYLYREFFGVEKGDIAQGNDIWVLFTAAKTLQEMEDLNGLEVSKYVGMLKSPESPNMEDPSKLESYYDFIVKFYSGEGKSILSDYEKLWEFFGIPSEIGDKVILKCREMQKDPEIMKGILGIYEKALKKFLEENS